jgi:hypothetical protein
MEYKSKKDLPHILLRICASSYWGAYKYHTRHPIKNIEEHQDYQEKDALIEALAAFRRTKTEELKFVQIAVGRQDFFSTRSIIILPKRCLTPSL